MEKDRKDVISKLSRFEKAKRWLWRKFDRSITFDDIRELPDQYMYPIGFIVSASYVIFFLFFVRTFRPRDELTYTFHQVDKKESRPTIKNFSNSYIRRFFISVCFFDEQYLLCTEIQRHHRFLYT